MDFGTLLSVEDSFVGRHGGRGVLCSCSGGDGLCGGGEVLEGKLVDQSERVEDVSGWFVP